MEFKSKVFVENQKNKVALKVIVSVVFAIYLLLILLKIIVGDFSMSDITSVFIPLLIIFAYCRGAKSKAIFSNAVGKADFGLEKLTIIYENVDGGKKLGTFTETTEMDYEDIESIEFVQEINCYKILASCITKRIYVSSQKEEILQDKDTVNQVFIYFLDEREESQFRKMLQDKAHKDVKVED